MKLTLLILCLITAATFANDLTLEKDLYKQLRHASANCIEDFLLSRKSPNVTKKQEEAMNRLIDRVALTIVMAQDQAGVGQIQQVHHDRAKLLIGEWNDGKDTFNTYLMNMKMSSLLEFAQKIGNTTPSNLHKSLVNQTLLIDASIIVMSTNELKAEDLTDKHYKQIELLVRSK